MGGLELDGAAQKIFLRKARDGPAGDRALYHIYSLGRHLQHIGEPFAVYIVLCAVRLCDLQDIIAQQCYKDGGKYKISIWLV